MVEWMEWEEIVWSKQTRTKWVRISETVGYGVGSVRPYITLSLDYDDYKAMFSGVVIDALPGWIIVDAGSRRNVYAGPFDNLDAAKAAYLCMMEVV